MALSLDGVISAVARLAEVEEAVARAAVHGEPGTQGGRALALVGFDADSIQEQVFASPRPVTIAGASQRLRRWDQGLADKDEFSGRPVVPLFSGGGQATLLTLEEHAPAVIDALEKQYESDTLGSTATAAFVPATLASLASGNAVAGGVRLSDAHAARIGWSPEGGGGFGGVVSRLSAALRARKGRARGAPGYLLGAGSAARCEECAARPRDQRRTLCERCVKNRSLGGTAKSEWESAQTFEVVAKESGLLAFVAADGRGVGAVIQSLRTVAQSCAPS